MRKYKITFVFVTINQQEWDKLIVMYLIKHEQANKCNDIRCIHATSGVELFIPQYPGPDIKSWLT